MCNKFGYLSSIDGCCDLKTYEALCDTEKTHYLIQFLGEEKKGSDFDCIKNEGEVRQILGISGQLHHMQDVGNGCNHYALPNIYTEMCRRKYIA